MRHDAPGLTSQDLDALPRVSVRRAESAAAFQAIVAAEEPVVIEGALEHWPALAAGRCSAAAMNEYLKSMDTGSFIEVLEAPPQTQGRFLYTPDLRGFNFSHRRRRISETLDHLLRSLGEPNAPFIAIQSLPLASHLPEFVRCNPAPFLPPQVLPRLWVAGPVRTQTHHDPEHNLACVIAGRRRFLLFPPEQVANLYVGPIDKPFPPPLSLVDPAAPDFDRFPRFRRALQAARVAHLEAGDAIFMPKYWWHHVTSLEPYNALVNYWWGNDARGLERPMECFLTALLAIKDLPPGERAYWRTMFDTHVFKVPGEDPVAHIPVALQGLLGKLDPELRARLKQQLRMTYLKS
ncbi:MAG TPA: cupin-like domain-containing protein [Steroidobacteraceae bacterium]|nr:cupin-like domain-containing protein [Steroidobacteraceae bacterium]